MNRITKLLFVAFIVLIAGTACGNRGGNENLTIFVIDDQKPIGDDLCGGIVNRIYLVGPLPEDTPYSEIIEEKGLLVYEEEVPFVLPHEIEIVERKTVYLKDLSVDVKGEVVYLKDLGVDPEDFSVTFSSRNESSHCYVSQIGETRWIVTYSNCDYIEVQEQKFVLIDGPRGINEWRYSDPPHSFNKEWEDGESESVTFLDGLVFLRPNNCNID